MSAKGKMVAATVNFPGLPPVVFVGEQLIPLAMAKPKTKKMTINLLILITYRQDLHIP
jgi:hypothetical protein